MLMFPLERNMKALHSNIETNLDLKKESVSCLQDSNLHPGTHLSWLLERPL